MKMVLPVMGRTGIVKYVALGILSGLSSFIFIQLLTRMVSKINEGSVTAINWKYVAYFAGSILLFILTRKTLALAVVHISQTLFKNLRKHILTLVLKAGYPQLVARRTEVHAAIVSDVAIMTQASTGIIEFFTAIIVAVSCLAYLSTISLPLFGITLLIALTGVGSYYLHSKKNINNFAAARKLENRFQEHFNAILNGFREIYMEPRKGKTLFDHRIVPVTDEIYNNNKAALSGFITNQVTGQLLFYVLVSSILLIFSILLHIPPADTTRYLFTLLYLLSAIETVMVLLPNLMRARVAAAHLVKLKNEVEQEHYTNTVAEKYITREEFRQITVQQLEFRYEKNDTGFQIGPVDFDINRGEIVFIYGGNGSGKTTFMHNLLGICTPTGGSIRLNNTLVNEHNYPEYRTAFSVVFSDFYLFDGPIGIDQIQNDKWLQYLELFELEEKVKLEGALFSTTDLSAGQRKRLALIAALLENKPVLVLDEWAADQDPYFRKKFYTHILPVLKAEGLTIIAITHDDKYYHCADRLYRMDFGRISEESLQVQA